MAMVEGIHAGCIGISQEWFSLFVACAYDMIFTDGLTDRLIDRLADGRIILVGVCNQSCKCIRRGKVKSVNDAELKRYRVRLI